MTGAGHRSLPPTSIAVLLGGPSAEHDVSLVSGRAIAAALAGRGHPVDCWLIDLDGSWWSLPPAALDPAIVATSYDDPGTLGAVGPVAAATALERLAGQHPPPVVFPALHGPFGEDGTDPGPGGLGGTRVLRLRSGRVGRGHGQDALQATLRRDGPAGPAMGGDPCPRLVRTTSIGDRGAGAVRRSLPDPRLIIKPARLGSSIGISIVHRPDEPPELERAIEAALAHDDLVMAEPYLDHPRELEVALVGDAADDLEAFGPGEVVSGREFYDYVAKYRSSASSSDLSPQPGCRPRRETSGVSPPTAFLAIGASGFARVDFLLSATARCTCRRSTPSRGSRPSACSRRYVRPVAMTSGRSASASSAWHWNGRRWLPAAG